MNTDRSRDLAGRSVDLGENVTERGGETWRIRGGVRQGYEKNIQRGYCGAGNADVEIEERYGEGKEDMKRGEWGHETCRCYVSHTQFTYISFIYILCIPYVHHTDLRAQLRSYTHVCTYVREEKNRKYRDEANGDVEGEMGRNIRRVT